MLRLVNPLAHGVLDYGLAVTFLLAPFLFGMRDDAATLAYATGFIYIGASLVTRYPLGVLPLLAFPVHGVLESVMAASWIVLPWLLRFAETQPAARNFFVAAGIALLAVVAVTDYRGRATRAAYAGAERRQRGFDRRRRTVAVARDRRSGERRGAYAAA